MKPNENQKNSELLKMQSRLKDWVFARAGRRVPPLLLEIQRNERQEDLFEEARTIFDVK